MVNVNCTQENPPKNRIVLTRCSTEICDSQSYSSPWCAQLCNSNSHPDCLALGGSSCWWLFPIGHRILLPLLSRSFHLDDFFFAAEDQDSRFNWNFHFAQLQKISDLTFWIHNQGIMTNEQIWRRYLGAIFCDILQTHNTPWRVNGLNKLFLLQFGKKMVFCRGSQY